MVKCYAFRIVTLHSVGVFPMHWNLRPDNTEMLYRVPKNPDRSKENHNAII
jgi:hypothetical protein